MYPTLLHITKDPANIYGVGKEIYAYTFFRDYCETYADKGTEDWLCRIPFAKAIDYCAKSLHIEFRYI